jgi:hypothetical protein
LGIDAGFIQVTNACLRICQRDTADGKMVRFRSAKFPQNSFWLVPWLRPRAERARQQSTFDQPAVRPTTEIGRIFDANRTGPPRRIGRGQFFPHLWTHHRVSIGVENGIVTDHRFSFLPWVSVAADSFGERTRPLLIS